MKTLTVTIHFLEPFRVIEWHEKEERNGKRFMRGYGFARWHNKNDKGKPCNNDDTGRPYITGTLVRSAFLNAVEQILWMNKGMDCCPGEFKDSNAKVFHHPDEPEKLKAKRLRRRQTLKWESSKKLCDKNSAEPCPLCLLLGRCDNAEAGAGDKEKEKFDVKFSNFNIGMQEEMRLEDLAQSRIINRVDQEDGKAEDFVKIWEIAPKICGDFTGHIHLSEKAAKNEKLISLIDNAAVLVDRIAGSLCSVTIKGETQKNACPEIHSAEDRNNYFKELAAIIEKGFQDGNKTVHLRLFADVIREMRCKNQSVLQNLPKGHKERSAKSPEIYKDHYIWDEIRVEGEKLRKWLPEIFTDSAAEWTVFCQKLGQALYEKAKISGPEQFPAVRPVGAAEGVHISADPQTELEKNAGEKTLHEILVTGQFTACTPFFFGYNSGEEQNEQTSMQILRTKDGSFRLPRSVLRGILRRDLKLAFGTGCRAELGIVPPARVRSAVSCAKSQ